MTACKPDQATQKKKPIKKEQKEHKKPLSVNDQKQNVIKRLDGWKSDVDREISSLKTNLKNSSGAKKEKLNTQLAALERWSRKLDSHKKNVQKAGPGRWKKVKNQALKAVKGIEEEWKQVFSK